MSNKELSKIVKGTLAVVLAGTFTFSASKAFADESAGQTSTTQAQTNITQDTTVTAPTTETKEAPSLLPGDFFYFAKLALEKIKLALTFDKVKDAQLLASYASERLAEAEALYKDGKQDEALNAIKAAMEDMKNADNIVNDQSKPAKSTETAKTDETVNKDEDHKTEDRVNEDTQKQEKADDQKEEDQKKADDQKQTDDQTATDEQKNDETAQGTQEIKKVNDMLSQNIAALTAAMEKVKNPTAKAALQKNIEKMFVHFAEKMKKQEEKLAKKQKEIDTENVNVNNSSTEVSTETNTEADGKAATETNAETDVKAETKTTATASQGNVNTAVTKAKAPVSAAGKVETKTQVHTEAKPAHAVPAVPAVPAAPKHPQVKLEEVKKEVKHVANPVSQTVKEQVKQKQEVIKSFVSERPGFGKEQEHQNNGRN